MRRAAILIASLGVIAAAAGLLFLVRPQPRSTIVVEDAPPPVAAPRPKRERTVAPPPAAPSSQAVANFDEGARLVRNAVQSRRWTPEDSEALDVVLNGVTPEQQTELLHALIPRINRGEVKLTYRGAIF